jgi:hypothetical protein
MMRFIQRAICGAKTFSGAHICSKLQNIIFATVEDQFKPIELRYFFQEKVILNNII